MKRLITLILLAPALACANGLPQGQQYTFTDLGTLADLGTLGGTQSAALGINDSGQVVGWSYNAHGTQLATLWNGSVPTDLGTSGAAFAINNAGEVVGQSGVGVAGGNWHAFLWNGGSLTGLRAPGNQSGAYAINNAGKIAGYSSPDNGVTAHALVWTGTTPTALGAPSGSFSAATGINEQGTVVGYTNDHAVVWHGTTPTDLGATGGWSLSFATAINDAGQIVGVGEVDNIVLGDRDFAVRWSGTTQTVLGTLGGSMTEALAINNAGEVVGFSTPTSDDHDIATIWSGTQAIDLNTRVTNLPAGFTLIDATGINNSGQIVGYGWNSSKQDQAFLLTPRGVPEPNTTSLLLLGFAGLAFLGHRRKPRDLLSAGSSA